MDSDDHVPPSRFFDRYSSSSSDDDEARPSLHSTNRRLDCMIQFLDRKLSTSNSNSDNPLEDGFHRPGSLPEFVGRRGGQGIFRPPDRRAVHPKRPPSLEVRPHPLRETQIGRFLRTIVTTERQLWAGSESGAVRVWDFRDLYGGVLRVRREMQRHLRRYCRHFHRLRRQ